MSTFFCKSIMNSFFCRHSNNSRPEFVGPLSINDHLKQAKRLFENQIVGPESFAVDKEGTTNVPTHTLWYSGYPQWPHRCSVWDIFIIAKWEARQVAGDLNPIVSINSSIVHIQLSIFVHIWYSYTLGSAFLQTLELRADFLLRGHIYVKVCVAQIWNHNSIHVHILRYCPFCWNLDNLPKNCFALL